MLGFIANEPWRSSALPNMREAVKSVNVHETGSGCTTGEAPREIKHGLLAFGTAFQANQAVQGMNREKGVPYSRHYIQLVPFGSGWKRSYPWLANGSCLFTWCLA